MLAVTFITVLLPPDTPQAQAMRSEGPMHLSAGAGAEGVATKLEQFGPPFVHVVRALIRAPASVQGLSKGSATAVKKSWRSGFSSKIRRSWQQRCGTAGVASPENPDGKNELAVSA